MAGNTQNAMIKQFCLLWHCFKNMNTAVSDLCVLCETAAMLTAQANVDADDGGDHLVAQGLWDQAAATTKRDSLDHLTKRCAPVVAHNVIDKMLKVFSSVALKQNVAMCQATLET